MAVVPGSIPGMGSFHLRFTLLGGRLALLWGAIWAVGWILFALPEAWLPFLYRLEAGGTSSPVWLHFVLSPPGGRAGLGFAPWQLLTAPLLYPPVALGGFVVSALGLGFFGGTVERFLGARRFLELCAVSLVGAVGMAVLFGLVQHPATLHYGVAPVILALIVVHCSLTPEATVNFFMVLAVKMRWIAWAVGAIVIGRALGMFGPFGAGAAGGYELGGVLAGFLWWRYRDDLDPRIRSRRRKGDRLLRAVEKTLEKEPDGPLYH